MTKPTPGPWVVETYGSKTVLEIKSMTADGPPVVNWPGFDDAHRKHSEHTANAKLMAASPELLDACKGALEWLKYHGEDALPEGEPGLELLINKLQSAIKKVR